MWHHILTLHCGSATCVLHSLESPSLLPQGLHRRPAEWRATWKLQPRCRTPISGFGFYYCGCVPKRHMRIGNSNTQKYQPTQMEGMSTITVQQHKHKICTAVRRVPNALSMCIRKQRPWKCNMVWTGSSCTKLPTIHLLQSTMLLGSGSNSSKRCFLGDVATAANTPAAYDAHQRP